MLQSDMIIHHEDNNLPISNLFSSILKGQLLWQYVYANVNKQHLPNAGNSPSETKVRQIDSFCLWQQCWTQK